jgi:AraC-like DNA-binding protein
MLKGDASSIQEISCEIGYDDVSFFRTLFKRDTGMTPVEYRRTFAPFSVRGQATAALA